MMTRFRLHRGGLAESVATTVPVASRAELDAVAVGHLREVGFEHHTGREPCAEDVTVQLYGPPPGPHPDNRIGWKDTWIVMAKDWGPVGFTDGGEAGEDEA